MQEYNNFMENIDLDFISDNLETNEVINRNINSSFWFPIDSCLDTNDYVINSNLGDAENLEHNNQHEELDNLFVKIEDHDESSMIKEEALSFQSSNDNYNETHDISKHGCPGVSINSKNTKKKRRLKGHELIISIKQDPVFSKHQELLDKKLDDMSRKRMMQKIRNRISAQESRDRRKVYIDDLEKENSLLRQENQF